MRGRGGVFNVTVDDQLIYSKHETGQFPRDGEIVAKLKERAS